MIDTVACRSHLLTYSWGMAAEDANRRLADKLSADAASIDASRILGPRSLLNYKQQDMTVAYMTFGIHDVRYRRL